MVVCNEEDRLRAGTAIDSCRGVVGDVVIVVQESTDGTLAVARSVADTVIEHPCHGYSEPSRPDGLAACRGEWVLYLDADESLTPEAASRLARLAAARGVDLYRLRRLTTIGGGTYEDAPHPRLFRKSRVVERGEIPHRTYAATDPARERTVDDAVMISHAKTWAEQNADNHRYETLKPPPPPHFREGTTDAGVWDAVANGNEYGLPDRMDGLTVLDVGGNIGSFAHACLTRGAAFVLSVEPDAGNFASLVRNTSHWGTRIACVRAACWRNDPGHERDRLTFTGYGVDAVSGVVHAASGSCVPGAGEAMPILSLDRLIQMCGTVDLLKIDAEGVEAPALLTCTRLDGVREIRGETHDNLFAMFNDYSPLKGVAYSSDAIRSHLERCGFEVNMPGESPNGLRLFHATR